MERTSLCVCFLYRQIQRGTVIRAGMQIDPGGGDRGMPQDLLHQVDRRPPLQRMRGMGMAQPVRGYRHRKTGSPGVPYRTYQVFG